MARALQGDNMGSFFVFPPLTCCSKDSENAGSRIHASEWRPAMQLLSELDFDLHLNVDEGSVMSWRSVFPGLNAETA